MIQNLPKGYLNNSNISNLFLWFHYRQTVGNIKTKPATWQPGVIGNNNKRILEILEGVAEASNFLKTDTECEEMRQQCNDKVT